jgi:hypothetical protein
MPVPCCLARFPTQACPNVFNMVARLGHRPPTQPLCLDRVTLPRCQPPHPGESGVPSPYSFHQRLDIPVFPELAFVMDRFENAHRLGFIRGDGASQVHLPLHDCLATMTTAASYCCPRPRAAASSSLTRRPASSANIGTRARQLPPRTLQGSNLTLGRTTRGALQSASTVYLPS